MLNLTQTRTLAVSGAGLPTYGGTSILTPVRLSGTEKLGELFEYTLELKTPDSLAFSPSIAANINLNSMIGTEMTCFIELEGNGEFIAGLVGDAGAANIGAGIREISGLISDAAIIREEGRSIVYRLTLRPALWLATKNQESRLFQDMTVIETTDTVLAPYMFSVEKRLIESYPKRDIQRQYWESDFDYLGRLWQEWGIYYWFEHSDGKHRLVLCDSIGAHKPHGPAYESIRYEPPTGRRIDQEHIHTLLVNNALTTGAVSTVDYDYTRPRADMRANQHDPRDTAFANQEHYGWGDYAQPQAGATGLSGEHNQSKEEGNLLALVRVQALRCQGLRASGQGNLRGLTTGQTFNLTHYPQSEANREYLVVSSALDIQNVAEETQPGSPQNNVQRYRCVTDFVIQPTSSAFRSLCTIRKPRTQGPETAVVVGPANQEIWTDAYARVKVQFPWDRLGQFNERSGCWLRVASSWQGNEFGAVHLPRVGQEILIEHLNGDPDLPIVTGRVVNAFQMPPWKLPGNQALSGFRSRELGKGGGAGGRANHLVMDDTEGKIQAQLSSDHALSQLNLGSIARIPGNAGRQDERGNGFELRTDDDGVLRAGRGMLITTESRPNAQAHAKDMGETVNRLTTAQRLHDALAKIAQENEAQEEGDQQDEVARTLDEQNQAIRGAGATQDAPFPELSEPHLVIAGKAGIELTTPGTTHIATGQHTAITSEGHVSVASGQSLFATIRNTFRLLVQQAGMRLIAASGSIDIQALTHSINLLAKMDITLTSETITIKAKKRILIDGGGSYIRLEQGLIKQGTNGDWIAHAANHHLPQPDEIPVELHVPKVCVQCLLKASKSAASIVPRL